MKIRKEFVIERNVIVFLLMAVFLLPCVSFATSFSNTEPGSVDISSKNIQQMSFDNRSITDSDKHHFPRNLNNTPIPPAIWLLGTGLVGLIGVRRKLKK